MTHTINIHNGAGLNGRLAVVEYERDRSGVYVPVRHWEQKNLVTAAGKNLAAALIGGESTSAVTHMAFGTGSIAPAASDIALATEVYRGEISQTDAVSNVVTFRFFLPSAEANGSTLREAGLFTSIAGGTLFARTLLLTPIEKTEQSAYLFTWNCTVG